MECKVFCFLALLWMSGCHGQTTPSFQFMPGSSPSNPNLALAMCQQQAVAGKLTVTRAGKYADDISAWCSMYEQVLPCLSRTLQPSTNAKDTFLKLTYNETIATRMSRSLCQRFAFQSSDIPIRMANLSCVDAQIGDVQRCVSENTHFYVEKFNKFNSGEMPGVSQENVTLPPIYACIISVATASCFHKALALAPGCSIPQRKLMYDYYTMMSGNCRTIAGVVDETPTTQESTTQETLGTNQRSVETRNQAETIQQQTTSDVTRGGKRRGGNLFETDVTRQRAEVASAGAGNATTTQMIGRLEMGRNATVESPRSECPVFRAKLLLVFAVMVASVLCVL